MTISKVEYLILYAALKDCEALKNVASDWQLPHVSVASSANRLFQNGDILAGFSTDKGESIKDIVLTMSQIRAHLDGRLNAFYYLTPQGGAKWETLCNADWNRYYRGYFASKYDVETGLSEAEVISPSCEVIENYLRVSGYFDGYILIPETVIWSEIESWQATYWKILPKSYKVRYKYRNVQRSIDPYDPQEQELDKKIKKLFAEMQQWYTEPKFEETPPNPIDYEEFKYYTSINQLSLLKAEYLILEFAVIFQCYSLENVAYSKGLSHAETASAADSLFQRGDIRARVFADQYDFEGTSNVLLTKAGIQDHLDGRIRATYYLTPTGGASWEALAHPDWNKFFIVNLLENFPYNEGILSTRREIIEKLLALDKFVLIREHIPGTEVWSEIEPWQATYWKTLPRGYHVHCEYKYNAWDNSDLGDDTPIELIESEQALQWYTNARK